MATNELRKRANWQTVSGAKALKTEDIFHNSLKNTLNVVYPGQFIVDKHPKDFSDIYSTYELPQEDLDAIYNVNMYNADGSSKYKWGITMDFAIRNQHNGKILFGEIKDKMAGLKQRNQQQVEGMHMKEVQNISL